MKKILKITVIMYIALLITSCLPGDGSASASHLSGFFWGIWHGWLAPLSLIISIFKENINIYEIYNKGFSYDLGFYMAILGGFGGFSLVRRKKNQKKDK